MGGEDNNHSSQPPELNPIDMGVVLCYQDPDTDRFGYGYARFLKSQDPDMVGKRHVQKI
jgi:hypothetical protein